MVKALIDFGFSVSVKNRLKLTPLDNSCQVGNIGVLKYLEKEGALKEDSAIESAAIHSVINGHLNIIEYLREGGYCDVDL